MSGLSKNKIKWIRSLQQKKHRDELGLFVVEGEKMVLEAIEYAVDQIEFVAHTEDFYFRESRFESFCISSNELEQISTLKTPNKVLAVLRKRKTDFISENKELIIALDGIQDPGNMGTILRIADWYGVNHLVCSKNTVECYNSKVVQSSMGAIFRVQTHYIDLKEWLLKVKVPIYGALLEGENVYHKEDLPSGILLMGNEGKGISEELLPLISDPISIPRFGKAESLNVSVATGILISEFMRKS